MVMGGPMPGVWFVCEHVKADGKKCGHKVEVHITINDPDDPGLARDILNSLYLRHASCSGTMRRLG